MSMRRRIRGLDKSEIKALGKKGKDEVDLPVTMEDFETALQKTSSSINKVKEQKTSKLM